MLTQTFISVGLVGLCIAAMVKHGGSTSENSAKIMVSEAEVDIGTWLRDNVDCEESFEQSSYGCNNTWKVHLKDGTILNDPLIKPSCHTGLSTTLDDLGIDFLFHIKNTENASDTTAANWIRPLDGQKITCKTPTAACAPGEMSCCSFPADPLCCASKSDTTCCGATGGIGCTGGCNPITDVTCCPAGDPSCTRCTFKNWPNDKMLDNEYFSMGKARNPAVASCRAPKAKYVNPPRLSYSTTENGYFGSNYTGSWTFVGVKMPYEQQCQGFGFSLKIPMDEFEFEVLDIDHGEGWWTQAIYTDGSKSATQSITTGYCNNPPGCPKNDKVFNFNAPAGKRIDFINIFGDRLNQRNGKPMQSRFGITNVKFCR